MVVTQIIVIVRHYQYRIIIMTINIDVVIDVNI